MTARPFLRTIPVWILSGLLFIGQTCAAPTGAEKTGDRQTCPSLVAEETPDTLTYLSPDNQRRVLHKRPARTVVLLTSLLDLWYEAGGKAVGRCAGELNVPDAAKDLPVLGTFANPNIEKLISLAPDLVISSDVGAFRAMIPILEASGIEYALVRYVNYGDYLSLIELFGKLNGSETHCRQVIERTAAQVDSVVARCPRASGPKVVIVFTSPNLVSCETADSQTGFMVQLLGGKNIISGGPSETGTRINFSLERLVLLDPDLVLINTMGDPKDCKARLHQELAGNSAWSALRAVREGRVHYLPKSLFLFKPNAAYPEAVRYLAALFYPDLFESAPSAGVVSHATPH
ncbi:MAG: ABC transporter substrate-binding protein [Pseudomonadota bacterium]